MSDETQPEPTEPDVEPTEPDPDPEAVVEDEPAGEVTVQAQANVLGLIPLQTATVENTARVQTALNQGLLLLVDVQPGD